MKKIPSEAELRARLRELTDRSRHVREELRREISTLSADVRWRAMAEDRPRRARKKR